MLLYFLTKPNTLTSSTTNSQKKAPKWLVISTLCLIAVLIAVLFLTSDKTPEDLEHPPAIKSETTSVATEPIFDIPAIIGQDIDQVRAILGPGEISYQATPLQIKRGDITSSVEYTKDGYSLSIDYYDNTSKVESMMYGPESENVNDYHDILKAGNLREDDKRYLIKPMPVLGKSGWYASVKITSNH